MWRQSNALSIAWHRAFQNPTFCAELPSEEFVEIYLEADFETLPQERRRFALLNIPRHMFSEATAAAARRAAKPRPT